MKILKFTFIILLLVIINSCTKTNGSEKLIQNIKDSIIEPEVQLIIPDTFHYPLAGINVSKDIKLPNKLGGFYELKKNDGTTIKIDLIPPPFIYTDSLFSKGVSYFKNYTTRDGLVLDAISCSLIDKEGNIWFGTKGGGASKFNGKTFVNYTTESGLPDNTIKCIIEDAKGDIWFGTLGGGVACYNGNSFKYFTIENGLANNSINCLYEDRKGNIWIGTNGSGISCYDGKKITNYNTSNGLKNDVVWSIIEDNKNVLWIGTNEGLSYFKNKIIKLTDLDSVTVNKTILSLLEDKNGNMWIGTDNSIVCYGKNNLKIYNSIGGLSITGIMEILEDQNGNLWFSNFKTGVSFFDGGVFTNYSKAQGLPDNSILTISEDSLGNIWFGSETSGVSVFEGRIFRKYDSNFGLAKSIVWSIANDSKGNMWFATDDGISKFDGKVITNYSINQGLSKNNVISLYCDKSDNIWIGTIYGGVFCFDGKSFKQYTKKQGMPNSIVWCISQDNKGQMWFGTDKGFVSCFDGKCFRNYALMDEEFSTSVMSICFDKKGKLWIGTMGNGAYCFDGEKFYNYTTKQGMPSNSILNVAVDYYNKIWLATDAGISRFDGSNFLNFNKSNNLPGESITQVTVDKIGNKNIVLGTNNGLAMLKSFNSKSSSLNNVLKYDVQNNLSNAQLKKYDLVMDVFNNSNYYPIKDVNSGQNCLLQDANGLYWIGTGSEESALVIFDYNSFKKRNINSKIVINNIKLNQQNINYRVLNKKVIDAIKDSVNLNSPFYDLLLYNKILTKPEIDSLVLNYSSLNFGEINKFYNTPKNLKIPYDYNQITFEYNAIQLSRSDLVCYKYMLEGYDLDWKPLTKSTEATFGNMNEGLYNFKVKALYKGTNGNNKWSEPLNYKFEVLPPWYRTWWMYISETMVGGGGVFIFLRLNSRRLRIKANELKLKVDIATHEIKQQKHVIEEAQKEISDSINYAKRIQNSFMASKDDLQMCLNDYFILFKPKDVVSGDFYWANFYKNKLYLCIADSTGHGIPGAFMSLLNISLLNEALLSRNLILTSDILNFVRKILILGIKPDEQGQGGKDGMDCSLMCIDFVNLKLQYSAANNPIWIVRNVNQTRELIELKPDKMPVGKHDKEDISFTQNEISLYEGDCIYALTDGYPDQFGGEKGKKFMSKNLKELIVLNSHLPMKDQLVNIENTFTKWVGSLEQIDDVTLFGLRV